ncbi:MAG: phytanoyl-CoA dioxygenase family protein [Ilumatobacter sp.]|nr:phytanoyl-CoA dioxygenase family protein [Ilumatobacter sp.]
MPRRCTAAAPVTSPPATDRSAHLTIGVSDQAVVARYRSHRRWSYAGGVLSDDQVGQYERDGFLVLPGFVPHDECAALRQRANELVDSWEPSGERTVFSTEEQERTSNREFLSSGSSTWCFFEPDAFDTDGELRQPKALSINKIGHAMHDLDPVFERFTYRPELADVAHSIGIEQPLALQSMYIFKQPGIGGEVTCHQDATFLYTDPITVTGFWFAIEDATVDNGCLWAAPGSHRTGLRSLFRRAGAMTDDDGTEFVTLDETPLPAPPDDLVPLEVESGTMVVLHGLLAHWSDVNRSGRSRHAYSVHCIDGTADYPAWNWLQRPGDRPLRRLDTVAG